MKLQTLVSTMDQKDHSLIERMNIKSEAIIVNQYNTSNIEIIESNDYIIKWINSTDRGLSKSRNVAISNANEEICLVADDDLIYVDNIADIIANEFEKNVGYDVLAFQVEGIDRKFKNYHKNARELNYITSMKVASVEIAFKLNSIKNKSIKFNEKFGSGSTYSMGEENIFLFDCLKSGLKVKYIPIKIADIYIGNSSWFHGFNEKYFTDLGAAYAAMSKLFSLLLIFQFIIRKRKLFIAEISCFKALKYMLIGRRKYLRRS